ncbi:hypothetical protein IMZ08_18065 [Bacillus luteolus]|uniref:DUF4134 domain-containing protein n=1 Tax=Litchfieldia luteola TaxID=682179 RepID=A0ABR9QN62_9BACI|nr:hypothetical protein [Cytobacillus luteolus]MBE4909945.1 hypothetical protein [Cytobacillus luteolus]MBP1942499.1 MFS superfamily sulfate permease-like transporter [Cytobacillus luteolus]
MEIILRKSGIYGLVLGLAIAILLVDYKDVSRLGHNGTVTTYKPIFEYIVSILRFGIIGMFVGLLIGWKSYERKNKTEKKKTYYIEFFIVVFLITVVLMFALNW